MDKLLEVLEQATNVKSLTLNQDTGLWTIIYRNNIKPDTLTSDTLIDFLDNA